MQIGNRVVDKKLLTHSRLLIPALIRIARLYCFPSYRELERIENADCSCDPFFKDKCVQQHLQAYPKVMNLCEQVKLIEEKIELITEKCDAIAFLIDKIADKIKNQFEEKVVNNLYYCDSSMNHVSVNLASAIVSSMLENEEKRLFIQAGCESGKCKPCCGWPNNFKTYALGIENVLDIENFYAVGSINFLEDVQKFFEDEAINQGNLTTDSKIKTIGNDYSKHISLLRTLVLDIIVNIEKGKPLKGNCALC